MFSIIPPVGVPFDWRTVFAGQDTTGSFARSLSDQLGGQCVLTSSGKAALWLVLMSMHRERPDKDEVILPDYTCWTVPSAVVRAGLKVKAVDIEQHTLGLDPEKTREAITPRTLAVVVTHLFGMPSQITKIETICRDKGVFLVDDAAQAYGALVDGKYVGSFGDAGVLSFGRGKNITTGNGGAAVIRHTGLQKHAEKIAAEMPVAGSSTTDKLQMAVYKLFFSRHLFWIPAGLPFLKLGETVYDTNFDISLMSPDRAARGARMLGQYFDILTARQNVAAAYRERLGGAARLNVLDHAQNAVSADLRFPVVLADTSKRERVLRDGRQFGITAMYPDTVSSVAALKPSLVASGPGPVARLVADRLITLPTHFGITKVDIDRICRFLMDAVK
jgi:perosamine synthetase